jgi:hypothetical protein
MDSTGTAARVVSFKRTARCRGVQRRNLPAEWTIAEACHYAFSIAETKPGVEVTLWVGERIEVIYRDGKIV